MSPTQEQRARWLALAARHNVTVSRDTADDVISLCAAITAEAVAGERARLSAGVEVTDAEIDALWREAVRATMPLGKSPQKHFARALLASQRDRETLAERERCARWHDLCRQDLEAWAKQAKERGLVDLYNLYVEKTHLHEQSAAAHRAGEEG